MIRRQGNEVIYYDLEGNFDDELSEENVPDVLRRDFSSVVNSEGTELLNTEGASKFCAPKLKEDGEPTLKRSLLLASKRFQNRHRAVIIRRSQDDEECSRSIRRAQERWGVAETYYGLADGRKASIGEQLLFPLLCCALRLDISTEESIKLDKLLKRFRERRLKYD